MKLSVFILTILLLLAGRVSAAGGTCPRGADYPNSAGQLVTLSSLGVTQCYYASKSSGNDGNTGTSESSPWAHIPGMAGCTSVCASVTPGAGTGFILKGGDSWLASDLPLQFYWTGTSTTPIYIGVDLTWPSSWSRPIFNLQTSQITTSIGGGGGSGHNYVIFDNVEFTGFKQTSRTGNPAVIQTGGNQVNIERVYIHNFTTATTTTHSFAIATPCCGNGGLGTSIHDNVIDGSDSQKTFMGGVLHGSKVYNNVIRYVYNGMLGVFDIVHDNMVEYNYASADGDHANLVFLFGPMTAGNNPLVYNNVIRHTQLGVTLWLYGLTCYSYTGYAFNNVLYSTQTGNIINPPGNIGGCSKLRTWYFFNNTVQCGTNKASGVCFSDSGDVGQADNAVMNFINNHWLTNSVVASCAVVTCKHTTELTQSAGTATRQGYTADDSAFAFRPTKGSERTVSRGTNLQSLCSIIAGFDSSAGAACRTDTRFACIYDTSNHAVSCPAHSTNDHPSSSAWDIGAYQF